MNERIGTFCEKCREVVCRCAENEANLKKATENVVKSKPSDSFGNWVKFFMEKEDKLAQEKTNTAELFEVKEPYGWCIEWNISSTYYDKEGKQIWTGHNHWSLYWKHKVYPTKEVCLLALKAIKANNDNNQYIDIKYRIFPVYQGKIEEV